MNFIGKVSGINAHAPLSPEQREEFMAAYPAAHSKFVKEFMGPYEEDGVVINHPVGGGSYYMGGRCGPDRLLSRLNGFGYQWPNYTPEQWVLDALRDAASADYHYAFEKDYR
jgi:hypothetical protein